MFEYIVENANFKIPQPYQNEFLKTSDTTPVSGHFEFEYDDGLKLEIFATIDNVKILSNKEFILDNNGNYILKN